jgi:hypothetical protein
LISIRSGAGKVGTVVVSGLPAAAKIYEIDQPAGLAFSIEKESAVCASHLLLGSLDDTAFSI